MINFEENILSDGEKLSKFVKKIIGNSQKKSKMHQF